VNHTLLHAMHRLRLVAILAGLAWLVGMAPGLPVRLLALAIVLDALADTRTGPRVRVKTPGPFRARRGGGRR
jgi:hypothetical protein